MHRFLPWLFACALAVAAAAVAVADGTYIAIGDSITVGSSWPSSCGICPVVFDCTGGCSTSPQSNRDKCGYVRRLDAWLGSGYYVKNEGVGGEDTTEALSRFASEMNSNCAGSPGDCIAVILMHGTNDMDGAISPESARDNLSAMIDQAESRNIDVLLMSIVRKVYDFNNAKWLDYRNLTLALAGSKDLESVDPHTPLCSDNWACYNLNYWVDQLPPPDGPQQGIKCTAPGEGDNNLGHLDPDGYDILTSRIQDEIPASRPVAPSPTSPSGTIMDTDPNFVWPTVSNGRWYQLEIDGSTSWWKQADHCSGGTCTVNPAGTLAEGPHTWRVRARSLRGTGSWSSTINFEVQTLQPPGVPTPTGPQGPLFESAPTYRWTHVATASEYDLEVRDSGDNLDASAVSIQAATACGPSTCSFVEGTELTGTETYNLKVKARNAAGESAFSSPGLDFTILDCVDPSTMDLEELQPSPVVTTETVERCGAVTAGTMGPYEIGAAGDLTVHTRDGFTAYDGFVVSGKLTVISP